MRQIQPLANLKKVNSQAVLSYLCWCIILCGCVGCLGVNYPTPISSARDIRFAWPRTDDIVLVSLPVKDYPQLEKFKNLRAIYQSESKDALKVTDEGLAVIASLDLPKLKCLNLSGSEGVTDEGIRELAKIPTLEWLGLQGTGITDQGLKIIFDVMNLTGLNIINCKGVTYEGL